MGKRNISIIIGVLVLVLGLFVAKGVFKPDSKDASGGKNLELKTAYEKIKSSKKPSIIIFSYDADCCPSTKQFFDEYNKRARQLMKDYEKQFETLFINTGILEEKDQQILIDIAKENGVSTLPSILLRDSTGKPFKVIEGPFDDAEVRKVMDGMVE
jgi:hypothetical protein